MNKEKDRNTRKRCVIRLTNLTAQRVREFSQKHKVPISFIMQRCLIDLVDREEVSTAWWHCHSPEQSDGCHPVTFNTTLDEWGWNNVFKEHLSDYRCLLAIPVTAPKLMERLILANLDKVNPKGYVPLTGRPKIRHHKNRISMTGLSDKTYGLLMELKRQMKGLSWNEVMSELLLARGGYNRLAKRTNGKLTPIRKRPPDPPSTNPFDENWDAEYH